MNILICVGDGDKLLQFVFIRRININRLCEQDYTFTRLEKKNTSVFV